MSPSRFRYSAVASAWLAFCDSTPENGCVYCLPGTHRLQQIRHRDTYAKDNMLSRGQEVDLTFDEDTAVPLTLRAGEMSIHHARTIHGSRPNNSDSYRIGFIINYITPAVRQKSGKDSATLVRGARLIPSFRDPLPPWCSSTPIVLDRSHVSSPPAWGYRREDSAPYLGSSCQNSLQRATAMRQARFGVSFLAGAGGIGPAARIFPCRCC